MRAHQLSPQDAESVEPAIRMVAVPIRCQCLVPVAKDRYQHFSTKLQVRVNGLLIENAEIDVLRYVEGGRYAIVRFSGTIAIFSTGILPAIEAARLPHIEFSGWLEGGARELKVEIAGDAVMVTPVGGKIFSLVAARH